VPARRSGSHRFSPTICSVVHDGSCPSTTQLAVGT
jgi:hypothetical protein